jgi:AraC-like DNA-binding protein/mannose-6-phosphate isomerase-like protein (cupin superfamily)
MNLRQNKGPNHGPDLVKKDKPPRSEARSEARWAYWRPGMAGIVEFGALRGCEVGLPMHFHDEDQVTYVFQGQRRFIIGGEMVDLQAGRAALIPAGVPHSSLPEPAGVICTNAYLPAGNEAAGPIVEEIERLYRKSGAVCAVEMASIVREHRCDAKRRPAPQAAPPRTDRYEPVAEIAARIGMSREGFSRRFAAACGMPPHAFWLMGRLNRARALLRAGDAIAEVAFETGFADQSHLTRCFRRAFGVTPGSFRAG